MTPIWRSRLLKYSLYAKFSNSSPQRLPKCNQGLRRSYNIAACMPEAAEFQGVGDYKGLYEFSINQSDTFWGTVGRQRLSWITPFHTVQNCDLIKGKIKWFEGGQLNVSVNCIDRHVRTCPERVALIWERDEPGTEITVTYRQLLELTCRLGNLFRRLGVRRGDCVTLYLPPCPLAVAAMLACARIGAVHSAVFAGFSAEALAERIRGARSRIVVTANQGLRGGRVLELKATVDQALLSCPSVQHVLVTMRTENPVTVTDRDLVLEQEMMKEDSLCEPVAMDSEDVLFLLYTSGSTGKPKGLVHTQAGYLLYAALTHRCVFDYHDGDVFGCVADIGWITGHSYVVYGPLCNGGTTVLFESTPVYPDPGRYWETVERLRISQFYGAPTAIRLLLKYGDQWVKKYDRSSLKTLGSVGEPINTEAWDWYSRVVGEGRCPVVDTWWQTETGGVCIAPRPADPDAEVIPGFAMRPFFGVQPALMDGKGKMLTDTDTTGALCISRAWPGMARSIHNDHQRFVETYCQPYPGFFFTGDGAHCSRDGYYQIVGRLDDVINVSGHRLGTAEIEDVVNQCQGVAESAVIGYSHDIKGQGVYVFAVLKEDVDISEEVLAQRLRDMVSKKIAKYAAPDFTQVVKRLPKTRSGKIMRRVLRKLVEGKADDLGDLSTLDDPAAVQEAIQGHRRLLAKGAKP
ncbi:acetyl-coenzyme A synthetase 2-like, mitochondrial isoform X1 [Anguilla anguilla]|uniref:acetyl-coenzyme A synthetase 2-like, mitochondrial isoform X1 n=2 Tax=Anguilla anguilla TaxID=7936 RepID=UPI0015AE98CF|nr:acetyl-coenzyme A synthetase 2-like, mitochondrial isoform X1 [Anguilla anguilla]